VATDSSGNVYVSYYNNSNPFIGREDIVKFSPSGAVLSDVVVSTGVSAIPGSLAMLGSSASQLNSNLKPGDILELQPDGELFAYRPSTGATAFFCNLATLSADESSIFDLQTGTYNNFGGAIQVLGADFGDFGVYNNNLVVAGESHGLNFVMRVSFANGVPSTAKVLVSSQATDGGAIDPKGVAVNAQGTVLTTLAYSFSPSGILDVGTDVAVGFNLFFDQGQGNRPHLLNLGYNHFPGIDSRGITTDNSGNFLIATGSVGSELTLYNPGIVVVSASLSYGTNGGLSGALDPWDLTVDAVTDRVYITQPNQHNVLFNPYYQMITASQLVVSAQPPSNVTAGSGFGLTIKVEDANGQVDTSFTGSVTVALATNPGGSTLGGTLTVTAVNGVATFSGLTLNKAGTGYTLKATSGNLTAATTSGITVTPAVASQLVVTQQPPGSVTAGAGFHFTITAEDRYGNVATAFNGSVTAALTNYPGGVTVTAVNGIAAFYVNVPVAGTGFTLTATSGSLTPAVTTAFNVIPAAAAKLVVTTEPPSTVTAGSSFSLTIKAEDRFGNVVPSFASGVTIALANNPGSSTLGGTLTVTAVNGVASFSGLTLNKAGSGYTLKASSGSLTAATTTAFNVT
jgi:hypothetical protein